MRRPRCSLPVLALGLLALAGACSAGPPDDEARYQGRAGGPRLAPPPADGDAPPGMVTALAETVPAPGDADDPAVWVHPDDPSLSLVIGTDKKKGLGVYDLSGQQLQFIEAGTPNNVDLRDGFALGGHPVSLVVAADDSDGSLQVYRVDPAARRLVDAAARRIVTGFEAHGLCLYRSLASGKLYAFPNDEGGRIEQWELFDDGTGRVDGRPVRAWDAGDEVEGCVADDEQEALFLAEQSVGVWRYGAEPQAPTTERALVDGTGSGGHLVADVEGVAIVDTGGGDGFLVASSQGDSSFSLYRRRPGHEFVGRFPVTAGRVDGCEETDGIEVVNRPLGPSFPEGLFVCHDGVNDGDEEESNFKLVPLELILRSVRP